MASRATISRAIVSGAIVSAAGRRSEVDLMMETESLDKLNGFCNARNFDRVCRYLCTCSQYAADTEEMIQSYTTAYTIYKTQKQYPDALRVA